jgi:hypothetical protein
MLHLFSQHDGNPVTTNWRCGIFRASSPCGIQIMQITKNLATPFRRISLRLGLCVAATAISWSVMAAQDPSMHEVYQAAEQGHFTEAEGMMDQVLKDHPNSAKAHFAEAELLAKQGLMSKAEAELRNAERLQPGLSFAKPQVVSNLKALISASRGQVRTDQSLHIAPVSYAAPASYAPASSGLPWDLILGGVGLLAFIFMATRMMQRRNPAVAPAGNYSGYNGYGNSTGAQPYATGPMGGGNAVGMAPASGGLGSGIMGSLATGAAMGAGLVAGEALMHHFTDGNRPSQGSTAFGSGDYTHIGNAPANDMGGNDFGIVDSSSWDTGSGGGDDSWD